MKKHLVTLLQMLHQNSHHHIHEDKLSDEHEGDEIKRRDPCQVGETVAVVWLTLS